MNVVYIFLDKQREAFFAARPVAALPPAYRSRVAAMTSSAARARTVAGLWLLGQALATAGRPAAALEQVGFAAGGRPELRGGPWFSISHSEALVACALAQDGPIGLDVEQRRAHVSPRLAERMTPPGGDFFAAWCAREATVKASGRVGLARVRAIELTDDIARLDGYAWPLCPLTLDAGYAACLAAVPGAALEPEDIACRDLGASCPSGTPD